MTHQDEILEMAKNAGMIWMSGLNGSGYHINHPKTIEAFAKLVAEKEREACIHVCREIYSAWMCETDEDVDEPNPNDCIRAIRARGQK